MCHEVNFLSLFRDTLTLGEKIMIPAIIELTQTYMVCGVAIGALSYAWLKYRAGYNARKAMKPRRLF